MKLSKVFCEGSNSTSTSQSALRCLLVADKGPEQPKASNASRSDLFGVDLYDAQNCVFGLGSHL
jgi:hypothetical protein